MILIYFICILVSLLSALFLLTMGFSLRLNAFMIRALQSFSRSYPRARDRAVLFYLGMNPCHNFTHLYAFSISLLFANRL